MNMRTIENFRVALFESGAVFLRMSMTVIVCIPGENLPRAVCQPLSVLVMVRPKKETETHLSPNSGETNRAQSKFTELYVTAPMMSAIRKASVVFLTPVL